VNRSAMYVLAAIVLLTGCKKDVSGSYLAADNTGICWLQLVRTPDDHLTGQLVVSELKSDGKIDHKSASLSGAVAGENIALTTSGFLGLSTATLSGTFDGKSLTLTGVQTTPVTLTRTTLSEYQSKLAEQTTRSQAIISAKADADTRQRTLQIQKNFVAGIEHLIVGMQQFDTEADVHLGRFPNAEQRYEGITAKISGYVTRERQLAGNSDHAVDRQSLYVDANVASLDTDLMHFDVQGLQSSLDVNIAAMDKEAAAFEQGCRLSGPVNGNLTPEETEAHEAACNRLLSAAPTFHQKYAAMTEGLNHLEAVYKHEKDAQQKLMDTARRLE
jgi:hypothetical protein